MPKADMSCVRVKQYKSSNVSASERHNERKNDDYTNLNVVPKRIRYNVHFKDPGNESYMDVLRRLEAEGKLSLRGLRQDATLFDELVIDVNTMYFEKNGGYEYAIQFYEEAYRFLEKKFGSDYIVSAVMHADEINVAATDTLRRDTYHYHLHAVVIPTVEKEIKWSKRCKDPQLRGTVKEVIRQVSHSKKWASTVPMKDENGLVMTRSDGKPKYIPSYSILQDEFVDHMRWHGYRDFSRGERGSTVENLTSLQYQIKKDTERLGVIDSRIQETEVKISEVQEKLKEETLVYEQVKKDRVDYYDIALIPTREYGADEIVVGIDDYKFVRDLAKEAVTSRKKISDYERKIPELEERYNKLADRFNNLAEQCKPYLIAIQRLPDLVRDLIDKVLDRLGIYDLTYVRNPQPLERKIEHKKHRGIER